MRLPRVRFTVRLMSVAVAAWVLSSGADPARVQDRDREVLEAVLNDVMDPRNPEYRGLDPGQLNRRGIVLHRMTGLRDEWFLGPALEEGVEKRGVIKEVGAAWSRRNSGPPVPTRELRLRIKEAQLDDLDAMAEKTVGADAFADAFVKKHPRSWGWVIPTLPGFSRDGRTAAVLLRDGPSPHGSVWAYQLVRFQDRWNVTWRWHKFWE
jgi:hypothetical protein